MNVKHYIGAGALLTIVSGAILFSTNQGAIPHIALSALSVALLAGAALRERSRLAWSVLALAVIESALFAPALAFVHAVLAQLIFAGIVALAAPISHCPPEAISLRRFVLAIPLLVWLQTSLGALYRHKITGVLPHMGGAMIVVLLTLLVSVILLQRLPQPGPLRSAAMALLSVVLVQITLGIGAFLMRLLDSDQTPVFAWVSVAHVTNGALTLGVSVILAMQIWRKGQGA